MSVGFGPWSGATLNRPGLDRLRDRVKEGALARVVIASPDRLARTYVHQMLLGVAEMINQGGPAVIPRPALDREMPVEISGVPRPQAKGDDHGEAQAAPGQPGQPVGERLRWGGDDRMCRRASALHASCPPRSCRVQNSSSSAGVHSTGWPYHIIFLLGRILLAVGPQRPLAWHHVPPAWPSRG
jgi:hypothetical protein